MGAPATPEELLGRLAALVCEGDEATVDEIRAGLAASIDQTLLDPSAGPERVAAWARDNAGEGYATLCVQPCNVGRVAWELERLGSPTRACCVVAFPHGQQTAEGVCFEVALALAAGAGELDLVMNYGAFLEGSYDAVAEPILAALRTIDAEPEDEDDGRACGCDDGCACDGECACGEGHDHGSDGDCGCGCDDGCACGEGRDHDAGGHEGHGHDGHDHEDRPLLKVILETGCLEPEQICRATDLVSSLGVDFVKTSTGFGPRGATADDVRLMCATVEPGVQVKAAGGIRCLADAVAMLEAGATRLGTSHGAQILGEFDALVDALSARRGDAETCRA